MIIVEHAPSTSQNHSNIQALDSLYGEMASNKKLFPNDDFPSQFESKKPVLEQIPPLIDGAELTKCDWYCAMTLAKPTKEKSQKRPGQMLEGVQGLAGREVEAASGKFGFPFAPGQDQAGSGRERCSGGRGVGD